MRRKDPIQIGQDAERKLADAAEALDAIEAGIIGRLKAVNLSGDKSAEAYALELVRTLQANDRQRRFFVQQITAGKLKEAELSRNELERVPFIDRMARGLRRV